MDLPRRAVRSVDLPACRHDGCHSAAAGGSCGRSDRRTLRWDEPRSHSTTSVHGISPAEHTMYRHQCRQTDVGDTSSRNLYRKLAPETSVKNWTQVHHIFSHQKQTLRPITLHGLCHVPDSFCDGTELRSVVCKKLVREKNLYQTDRHTCKFLVQDDLYQFLLVQVS